MQSLVSKDRQGQHPDVRAGAGGLEPTLSENRPKTGARLLKRRLAPTRAEHVWKPAREGHNVMVSVRVEGRE